jgi:hypothetical protein
MKVHDAARVGDLPEVTALLKDRPDLAFNKEIAGGTPYEWPQGRGRTAAVGCGTDS